MTDPDDWEDMMRTRALDEAQRMRNKSSDPPKTTEQTSTTTYRCNVHWTEMVKHEEGEHTVIMKCPRKFCTKAFVIDKGCSLTCSCGKADKQS